MFHFRSKIVEEFWIVSRVRGEINSADVFSKRMTGQPKPDSREF